MYVITFSIVNGTYGLQGLQGIPDDTCCFATLVYKFARLRPQVKLVVSAETLVC